MTSARPSAMSSHVPHACGDVSKDAIFMHPPYQGRVGYSFAMYDAVTLPAGSTGRLPRRRGQG